MISKYFFISILGTDSFKYVVCTVINSQRDGLHVCASLATTMPALTSCESHPTSSGPLKGFSAFSSIKPNASRQHS